MVSALKCHEENNKKGRARWKRAIILQKLTLSQRNNCDIKLRIPELKKSSL